MADFWSRVPQKDQAPGAGVTFVQTPRVEMFNGRLLSETEVGVNAPHERRANIYTGDLWTDPQVYAIRRANEAGANAPGSKLASPMGGMV
jgi:hypothetical protein